VKYSIDTSAILDGWVRYYPPEVFPALWSRVERLIATGDLRATEEVLVELEKKDDRVCDWARRQDGFFVPIDAAIQPLVSSILTSFEKLVDTRASRSGGDPFVIALAQLHACSVVTGEARTGSLNRPNIPDVCGALGLRCVSFLGLIRQEGWVFQG